jgi:hypothetical protein
MTENKAWPEVLLPRINGEPLPKFCPKGFQKEMNNSGQRPADCWKILLPNSRWLQKYPVKPGSMPIAIQPSNFLNIKTLQI